MSDALTGREDTLACISFALAQWQLQLHTRTCMHPLYRSSHARTFSSFQAIAYTALMAFPFELQVAIARLQRAR